MRFGNECQNDTDLGCGHGMDEDDSLAAQRDLDKLREAEWIEEYVFPGLRMWHVIFLSVAAALTVVILLCCCVKFRIPRTKQEIEGDYVRRKILRKFRRRLKGIQNQELDDMDLKKALDKIRAEFKSDTESLAQSEAGFSGGYSPSRKPRHSASTYRRASQLALDISLEDLRAQSLGLRARLMLGLSRLFGRAKVAQSKRTPPGAPEPHDTNTVGTATTTKAKSGPQVHAKPKTPPPSKSTAISIIPTPTQGSSSAVTGGTVKSGKNGKQTDGSKRTEVKITSEKEKHVKKGKQATG